MMSKRKILKGIDQQIENLSCSITDYELDDSITKVDVLKGIIPELKVKREELIIIKTQLEKLLI